MSERPRTCTVPDGLLHPGLQWWHSATSASCQPSITHSKLTAFPVQHLRPSGFFQLPAPVWNSLPDFIRGPGDQYRLFQTCSQNVFICSLDTSASSALGALEDMRYINALCYLLIYSAPAACWLNFGKGAYLSGSSFDSVSNFCFFASRSIVIMMIFISPMCGIAEKEMKLDGCIVWNAHNTVLGSKRLAVCATV